MFTHERILLDIVFSLYPESKTLLFPLDKGGSEAGGFLDIPPKAELGDFAFGTFPLAKVTKLAPPVIAENIAAALRENSDTFKSASILGGYVNFSLTSSAWVKLLEETSIEAKASRNETVVVDYIGANAGKPLHIGHLCTPSVGQALINTHEYLGYKVISDSHFGDWGGIFGKLISSWNTFSHEEREERLKNEGVDFLLELYQRFHEVVVPELTLGLDGETPEEIKKIGDEMIAFISQARDEQSRKEFRFLSGVGINLSDPEEFAHHEENVKLWERFTTISVSAINKKLELLNIFPQYNIGESFYEGLGLPRPNNEDYPDLKYNMKDVVQELLEKGIATQNEDGSVGVVFPEEMKLPSCVLQKKDGTSLYFTSDVAAIKYRLTNGWNPSKIIICTDMRQQLHFRQAFAIGKMAWPELLGNTELYHAFNGFIKLKEGAMSTRNGTLIFLEKLIDEGFDRTKVILTEKGQLLSDEDTRAIAVGAIKYSYLAQDREKDVTFDWDKALAFEGNSGPYIQYSYVRAKNILEKLQKEYKLSVQWVDINKLELTPYDTSLLRKLAFFEKAVTDTVSKYKPHTLAIYCYELASEFSSFYAHTPKILEEENETLKIFRLSLVLKVRDTLKKWFELLAINMPEKM